ncbi:MAG TPA: nucleoside triphosphate pyrophosphohydrolase [Candidatus Acidoferrales bacterium]|nr:nucleoside triphosphate pyrophosphohydrolase [Candidatus Acidoferrales bacterium]
MSRRFEDLVALQQKLLAPGGCPWDRQQTHETLRTYLLEETYEVLDALDAQDAAKIAEELGDLLLQILFHAELGRLAGTFDLGDVIESIYVKMVRRHPHVFGETKARDAAEVLKNWETIKAEERRAAAKLSESGDGGSDSGGAEAASSVLDGVPRSMPALMRAYQMTRRAAHVGFDWGNAEGVLEKVAEEIGELRTALPSGRDRMEEEAGDLLFAAMNVARYLKLDPELALRRANSKFEARFRAMELEAGRAGRKIADSSPEELDALWERVKMENHGAP